jgi:hypothetical protein
MSIGSALSRMTWAARPFRSSSLTSRSWAVLADVGYAAVIVAAGGVFVAAAAVLHGRNQAAAVWVGSVLVLVAVVLATIARIATVRKETKPVAIVKTRGDSTEDGDDGSMDSFPGDVAAASADDRALSQGDPSRHTPPSAPPSGARP